MGSALMGPLQNKLCLTDWEDRSRLTGVPKRSLCQRKNKRMVSDPARAEPICPSPIAAQAADSVIILFSIIIIVIIIIVLLSVSSLLLLLYYHYHYHHH